MDEIFGRKNFVTQFIWQLEREGLTFKQTPYEVRAK